MSQINEEERSDKKTTTKELKADIIDLEEYIQDLTTFIPIPLCSANLVNKIIDTNIAATTLSGYTHDELMGKKINLLFGDQKNFENLIKNTMDNGSVKNYDTTLITKDRKEIPIVIYTSLRKHADETLGYFVTFLDIFELKQMKRKLQEKIEYLETSKIAMLNIMEDFQEAQENLRAFNKELEQKVKERTVDVEKLLKQKDEFIGQLGHDLKSPLTPLVGLLPIIEKTEDDPKSKEILRILCRNVDNMKDLVTKTLELAELNATSTVFDIKDINLWESAENSIKDQQLMCDKKDFTVENKIDENIFVKADKLRLSEVLNNLINNAVKYNPPGGNITVDAHDDGDFVTVSVIDSGIGMTTEQIDHIFDEFYKADESRHDFSSSGLGLSICKRIVEKHGGRIWAESHGLGRGSTFYFTIPIGSKISKEDVSEKVKEVLDY